MTQTRTDMAQLLHDIHSYSLDTKNREIYIDSSNGDSEEGDGFIDYKTYINFIKNLRFLERQNKKKIIIHLHNHGGTWEDGMGMYDAVIAAKSKITMVVYGNACSMGGILLQAADRRVLMPHTCFMLHSGSASAIGTSEALSEYIKMNNTNYKQMLDIFVSRCIEAEEFSGWSEVKLSKHLADKIKEKHDWWLTAEEAVKYGFADGILGVNGCRI